MVVVVVVVVAVIVAVAVAVVVVRIVFTPCLHIPTGDGIYIIPTIVAYDYFVYNNVSMKNFTVTEHDINFSDHLPISIVCTVSITVRNHDRHKQNETIEHLRWDHADLMVYYNITRGYLPHISQFVLTKTNYWS